MINIRIFLLRKGTTINARLILINGILCESISQKSEAWRKEAEMRKEQKAQTQKEDLNALNTCKELETYFRREIFGCRKRI